MVKSTIIHRTDTVRTAAAATLGVAVVLLVLMDGPAGAAAAESPSQPTTAAPARPALEVAMLLTGYVLVYLVDLIGVPATVLPVALQPDSVYQGISRGSVGACARAVSVRGFELGQE